jgi:hypothetical protein
MAVEQVGALSGAIGLDQIAFMVPLAFHIG